MIVDNMDVRDGWSTGRNGQQRMAMIESGGQWLFIKLITGDP